MTEDHLLIYTADGQSDPHHSLLTLGEFLLPLIAYQIVPPIAPILNAPPASFKMTYGHGSLALSACAMIARVCWVLNRLKKQQGKF